MAKIKISEPEGGTYNCRIDSKVMEVTIEEAFLGIQFIAPDGGRLVVMNRDSGFEVYYSPGDGSEPSMTEMKAGQYIHHPNAGQLANN